MYLHLGNGVVVKEKDIIGIFDLDKCSIEKDTRDFLKNAQDSDEVVNVSPLLPKTFCVCQDSGKNKQIVYISQISTTTLQKRTQFLKPLQKL